MNEGLIEEKTLAIWFIVFQGAITIYDTLPSILAVFY